MNSCKGKAALHRYFSISLFLAALFYASVINAQPCPTITGTTPGSRCGTGTVVLGATASSGTLNWYSASTGGTSLGTGTSFTTPSISATTTYWVDATDNGCTTARTSVIATVGTANPVEVISTIGTSQACYATLKAGFDAINSGTHKGVIIINIVGNTTETLAAVLNANGSGSASYSGISIQPLGGVSRTISGSLATPLIDLNGASNVLIDGLNTGGNALTISNSSTSATATTIRFILDAKTNTIQNCNIEGSSTSVTIGTLFFSTGLPATGTGNDGNTVSFNNIIPAGSNLPVNAIYSAGTSSPIDNSGNSISDNNISDFFSPTIASNGVLLAANNSGWTISNNKFFQSATRSVTGGTSIVHRIIQVTSGNGYLVSGNTIGYNNSSGTGVMTYTRTAGTTTPLFRAIELSVGSVSASSIQGNIITAISFSTVSGTGTAPGIFTSISVLAGDVNIGTVTGNTIGSATGNGTITVISTVTGGYVAGIYATSTGTVNISNNTIGSVDLDGTAAIGFTFHGINTAGTAGNFTISSNTIGSTSTVGSVSAGISGLTTTGVCTFNGITNAATGTISISNNTIQNCTAYGTAASVYRGINNTAGSGTLGITGNSIIAGSNSGTGGLIIIANSAAVSTANINSNILRSFSKIAATCIFTGISSTGAITTALNVNNNQLGNTNTGLVTSDTACSGAITGITVTTATGACNLAIKGNDFRGIVHTILGSSPHTYIINTAATLSQDISNNSFTNLDVNTTGSVLFISNSTIIPVNGSQTISGNSIVTGFNKGGAGGTVTLFTSTALTIASGVTVSHTDNNFSNISLTGATTIAGWVHTDAGSSTKTFTGNIFNNWTTGAAAITGLSVSGFGGTSSVSNNTVTNLSSQAAITAVTIGASGNASQLNINSNTINNLVSSGTGGIVTGLSSTNQSSTVNVSSNLVNDLSSSMVGSGTVVRVTAITVSANTTININSNVIHTLSVSGTTVPIFNAITVASTGTVSIQDNLIHSMSTAGTATLGYTFNGISTSGAAGDFNISGNIIGDTSLSKAIAIGTDGVTTTGVCTFNGITNAASGTITISNNQIQNCWVYGTAASIFRGINNTGGTGTLSINTNTIESSINKGTGVMAIIASTAAASVATISYNILAGFSKYAATGTFTAISCTGAITTSLTINNNQLGNSNNGLVNYLGANSAALTGITVSTATGTCNLAIKNNDFRGIAHTFQGSSANTYIINAAATLSQDISNNTFTNLDVNTTGSIIFISNSVVIPANGIQTVSGNSIVTGFNKGGAGGTITLHTSTALSPGGGITVIHTNNNFSNITASGATTLAGWVHTEASGSSFASKTFTGNTFNNWTTGAAAISALTLNGFGDTSTISNNIVTNLSGQLAITAISIGATGTAATLNVNSNTINSLLSTGTGGIVTAISSTNLSTIVNINSNAINNLSSSIVGSAANVRLVAISVTANTTINIDNNIIHTLEMSGTTTPVFNAITAISTGNVTIQNNSIYSITTSGINTSGYTFNAITTAGALGNFTVSDNVIGSSSPNSISIGTSAVTTTGVCTFNGIINTATGSLVIANNTIQNVSVFGTGASVFTGTSNTAAASSVSISSNSITSVTNSGGGAAAIRGILVSNGTTISINQNTITGLTGNSMTTGSINGLLISGGSVVNAYQNSISLIRANAITTLAAGSINGLAITGGTDVNAYRNKIYDLETSSAALTGFVNGIIVSGATASLNANIRNNVIGDIKVTAGSGANLVRGISVISTGVTSSIDIYYNTIFLNANSSGANFGTSGIFHTASATATTATLDLRNNIIVNTSVPNGTGLTVAYRRSSAAVNTLNNFASSSNNNLFFTGTPGASNLIYSDGANNVQTIELYQAGVFTAGTIAPREDNSVTDDMITDLKFLSINGSDANFLHINNTKPTLAESAAVNIAGITIDYDGEIRQGNPGYTGTGVGPDIGADEFEGFSVNLYWTGAVSTDWNDVLNWRNHLPYSETNVIIPTGLSLYPVLNSGSAGSTKTITIQNGATVLVDNNLLKIAGSITNNGSFTTSNATIEWNGTALQTIPAATFTSNLVRNIIINNLANVTLAGALNITGEVTISNGSLNTGGFLTLKSTAAATARISTITSNHITPVNGDVNIERYIPGRRKYRIITSSVSTSPNASLISGEEALSIWGNWQNQGNNITANRGTFITGGGSADGFDTQTQNASLFTYNSALRLFTGFTTSNGKNTKYTPLKAGVPYYMFVFGDRTNSAITNSPNETILTATGTVLTGDQVYNTGSAIPLSNVVGGYTMIGNPYASPIDWGSVSRSNLSDTYWGWDPNLNSTGGYVTVSTTGTTTLIAPFSGSVGINQYIQPGQGFFVKTTAASPVLTIRETDKVDNFNGLAFRTQVNNIPLIAVNLFYDDATGTTLMDGALTAFDPGFSNGVGNEDATKMRRAGEEIAIRHLSEMLSIDARKMPVDGDTLFINSSGLTKSKYRLQVFAKDLDTSLIELWLEDIYLKTSKLLSLADTNNIQFSINPAVAASVDAKRFQIVFKKTGQLAESISSIRAIKVNRIVNLLWNVSSEINLQKYEVQRADETSGFTRLGDVRAAGLNSYEWVDNNPAVGINYYRVKLVKNDGSVSFSKTVTIAMTEEKPEIKIFPNPVQDQVVNMRLTNVKPGKYTVNLFNLKGQLIWQRQLQYEGGAGVQTFQFNEPIPPGFYILQIAGDTTVLNERIIIK